MKEEEQLVDTAISHTHLSHDYINFLLTGQAGAVRHGISKALLGFKGDHCDVLEKGVSFD